MNEPTKELPYIQIQADPFSVTQQEQPHLPSGARPPSYLTESNITNNQEQVDYYKQYPLETPPASPGNSNSNSPGSPEKQQRSSWKNALTSSSSPSRHHRSSSSQQLSPTSPSSSSSHGHAGGRFRSRSNASLSKSEWIEEGKGPNDETTPEQRALEAVAAEEDIIKASSRDRKSMLNITPNDNLVDSIDMARRAIYSDPAFNKKSGGGNNNGNNTNTEDSMLQSNVESQQGQGQGHTQTQTKEPPHGMDIDSNEAGLLPANFNPYTYPVDKLLELASTLHTTSKSKPATKSRRLHSGTKLDKHGRMEESDPRLKLSSQLFAVLADRGSTEGALMYGLALRSGWGITQDGEKGIQVLRHAVADSLEERKQSDDPESKEHAQTVLRSALYELGNSYMYGMGPPQDAGQGVYFFEAAAACGDADAMEALGDAYMSGLASHNGKEDKYHAAKWYRLAEASGKPPLVGMSWIHKEKYDPNADGSVKTKKHFWQK